MQIHELNNFTGTLGSGAYLAVDDGTDTGKISSQGLLAATEARIDNIIAGPAPSAGEIVDARLGADGVTYPSLGDAIRDQFTDVKSDLKNNDNGVQTFRLCGNFQHYGLYPDGSFITSQQYRVSNNDPMTFDRDLVVSVTDGFKWGYIPFVGGTAGTWSGWKTNDYTIPEGTSFVVQIARVSEDTSEIADVSTFVNAVTFPTIYTNEIESLKANVNKINEPYSFIDGYYVKYDTGALIADAGHEYTEFDISVFNGGTISGRTGVSPNTDVGISFYDATGEYISGAHSTNTGSYEFLYSLIVPNDAKIMRISLRKASASLWIKPEYSWMTFNKNIQSMYADVNENSTSIEIIRKELTGDIKTALFYGSFAQGGLNTDGSLKPEQYFRVSSTSLITVYQDTLISVDNGYKWGYIPFTEGVASEWMGWFTSPVVIPKGTSFLLQISTSTEVQTVHADPQTYASALKISLPNYGYSYGSDMIKRDITANKIDGTLLCRQGFCVYDDKYYSVEENKLGVQDSSFETLDMVTLSMGHANNIQLGNSNLAYVNGIYDHTVYVLNLDTKTIVNTISLPFSSGIETAVIDDINNIAYILHTDDPESTTTPQRFVFVAYDITNSQVIYTKPLPFGIVMFQGMDFYEGKIMLLAGNNTNTLNRLYVLDLNGTAIGGMSLTMFNDDEPEGIFYNRKSGELYVSGYVRKIYNIKYIN